MNFVLPTLFDSAFSLSTISLVTELIGAVTTELLCESINCIWRHDTEISISVGIQSIQKLLDELACFYL